MICQFILQGPVSSLLDGRHKINEQMKNSQCPNLTRNCQDCSDIGLKKWSIKYNRKANDSGEFRYKVKKNYLKEVKMIIIKN